MVRNVTSEPISSILNIIEQEDVGDDDFDGLACPPLDKEYISLMFNDHYIIYDHDIVADPNKLLDQDHYTIIHEDSDRFDQCLTCPPLDRCVVIDKDQVVVTETTTTPKQNKLYGKGKQLSVLQEVLKPKPNKPEEDEEKASFESKFESSKLKGELIVPIPVVKGKPKPKPKNDEDEASLKRKSESTKPKQELRVTPPVVKPKPKPRDDEDEASFGVKSESTKRKRESESRVGPISVVKPNPKPKDHENEASFESKLEATRQKLRKAFHMESKKRRTIIMLDHKDLPKQTNCKVNFNRWG